MANLKKTTAIMMTICRGKSKKEKVSGDHDEDLPWQSKADQAKQSKGAMNLYFGVTQVN